MNDCWFGLTTTTTPCFCAGAGHDVESTPTSSHSAHSSLLQHVLLLEQARQQTAMLAGMYTHTHTHTCSGGHTSNTVHSVSSTHVQPITTGDGRKRRGQWHALRQQVASPSAAGPYPECTSASVPPGPAAAGGSAAAPALPGETLQGADVQFTTKLSIK